jgi:hypothetical protein
LTTFAARELRPIPFEILARHGLAHQAALDGPPGGAGHFDGGGASWLDIEVGNAIRRLHYKAGADKKHCKDHHAKSLLLKYRIANGKKLFNIAHFENRPYFTSRPMRRMQGVAERRRRAGRLSRFGRHGLSPIRRLDSGFGDRGAIEFVR